MIPGNNLPDRPNTHQETQPLSWWGITMSGYEDVRRATRALFGEYEAVDPDPAASRPHPARSLFEADPDRERAQMALETARSRLLRLPRP